MKKSDEAMDSASPRLWRTQNVWAFSLASLFSDWGHELVTSLLPGFLIAMGAPTIALGLTEGVSNIGQAWAALWGGQLSDRSAARHSALLVGYILTGLKALIALVGWWPLVVIIRTLGWLGRGARGPIRDAYIAEEVPRQHLGKAYGLREAFDTAGALLGPLTAAVFVSVLKPRALIGLSVVPAVITIGMILRVKKLPMRVRSTPTPMPSTLRHWPPMFARYRAATGIFTAGYVAPTFFILRVWQSHATWAGVSAHTLALLLYSLHNAVYAASSFPTGRMADKMSGRTLLLIGYVIWVAAIVGFALDRTTLAWWIPLFAATGLATGIIEVGQKVVTVQLAPHEARGQGLGQIAAIRGVGQLTAGIVLGGLWTWTNPRLGFGVEALFAGVGLLLVLITVKVAPTAN